MAMAPNNSTKGSAFSQSVRALPKGARGAAVSAMAKAKVKPLKPAKPMPAAKPMKPAKLVTPKISVKKIK